MLNRILREARVVLELRVINDDSPDATSRIVRHHLTLQEQLNQGIYIRQWLQVQPFSTSTPAPQP